ncbi:MAG: alpha/beta hydrolase family protein [Promethearchaeota archaeon]
MKYKYYAWILERKYANKGENNLDKLSKLYSNKEEWEKRANIIRKGILRNSFLVPLPKKCELNAVVHSKREYEDFSVENYYFESIPGFYVTGNLYKPLNVNENKKLPIVISPHGHFKNGRFREDKQYLCSTLARMGAVVLSYDMVGYGDNTHVEHKCPHALTFQLLNSIRVLDFAQSLKYTDPNKIAVTGASGGGTQTFLLCAVDSRPYVSIPVVMVSSRFYGGCVCESGLPIHKTDVYQTNNAEISALFAPKPLLIISDGNDWTRFVPYREYPFIKRIYGFYNAENNIKNIHLINEKHDYGKSKRIGAYGFLTEHLNLKLEHVMNEKGEIIESEIIEKMEVMRAFNEKFPRPDNYLKGDEAIFKKIMELKEKS